VLIPTGAFLIDERKDISALSSERVFLIKMGGNCMAKETKKMTKVQDLEISSEVMDIIEKAIRDIFHGSVTLIVQDSHIVQIEKNEKIKLC
jgi:hypothetical protein